MFPRVSIGFLGTKILPATFEMKAVHLERAHNKILLFKNTTKPFSTIHSKVKEIIVKCMNTIQNNEMIIINMKYSISWFNENRNIMMWNLTSLKFIVPPPSTMEVILFNLMDVLFGFSHTDHFSKLDKRLLCDFHHPPQYMFLPPRMKRLEYLRWDLK